MTDARTIIANELEPAMWAHHAQGYAAAIIAALSAQGLVILTPDEANLVRQWFNSVTDVTPEYLEDPDRVLGERITRIVAAATPPGEAG